MMLPAVLLKMHFSWDFKQKRVVCIQDSWALDSSAWGRVWGALEVSLFGKFFFFLSLKDLVLIGTSACQKGVVCALIKHPLVGFFQLFLVFGSNSCFILLILLFVLVVFTLPLPISIPVFLRFRKIKNYSRVAIHPLFCLEMHI